MKESHHAFSCRELAERSSGFLEGTLSDEEWTAFRAHLELCPPCGEYVRQIGLTVELVRSLPGERGAHAREQLVARFARWKAERGTLPPR